MKPTGAAMRTCVRTVLRVRCESRRTPRRAIDLICLPIAVPGKGHPAKRRERRSHPVGTEVIAGLSDRPLSLKWPAARQHVGMREELQEQWLYF